jgi:hypothetical protein
MKGEIGLAIGTAVVFNRSPELEEVLVGEVVVEDGDVAS